MEKKHNLILHSVWVAFLSLSAVSTVVAEEKIIQSETLSFKKCLEVISTSGNKLSAVPELSLVSDQKRVAVFTLVDGTLKITCDAVDESLIVSTDTD